MNVKIKAQKREKGKKSDLKNLRKKGFIPAIIYGEGKEGTKVTLQSSEFNSVYKKTIGEMSLFDIDIEGEKTLTIIREKQIHPVSREIIHVDFVELHKGKPITLNVPIRFVGEPIGVKDGGVLDVLHRHLEVSCLPKDLPEVVELNVENLKIGETIHLFNLDLDSSLTLKLPDDAAIVAVRTPKKEEVEVEEEEEVEEEVVQE